MIKKLLDKNKLKITEYILYLLIVCMIFFILSNYKYQPSLSADELKAVEELNELKASQADFVEKNENVLVSIDLENYKVNTGYSDLLLLIQDLLELDTVSGYYNQETEESIRAFQKKHQLKETGKIDDASFAKIVSTTLPLSEEDLHQHRELVRLFQKVLNLNADGLLGDGTINAIRELKNDLQDDDNPELVNDVLLVYLIKHLNS